MQKKCFFYKKILLVILILFFLPNICFATETETTSNLIIAQLNINKTSENSISISYGYPIYTDEKLEQVILIDDEFKVLISELLFDNMRYATINCTINYKNHEDLINKLLIMKNFDDPNTQWIRFHFYLILDNITSNLNQQLIDTTLSFTINSDWLKTQRYHMTQIDKSIHDILSGVTDIKNLPITPICFVIIPSTNFMDMNCDYKQTIFSETENAYRFLIGDYPAKLYIDSEPKELSKLDMFLNSKLYYLFLIGSFLFILFAIKLMFITAKSFNKVVEREEKLALTKTELPPSNVPELYLTKEQREALEKSKTSVEKKDLFTMNDEPISKTESIEIKRHRKNK